MTVDYRVGDAREQMATIADGSVDLIASSPPFLALRSYLPAGHESKHAEIGSERNPAEFIDMLLGLTAEWGRVLAAHGSIAIELGDTYSGSGGAGGDYNEGGLRDGQNVFDGSASGRRRALRKGYGGAADRLDSQMPKNGTGWPAAKSLALIPQLYATSLAYGRNILRSGITGHQLLHFIDTMIVNGIPAEDAVTMAREWLPQVERIQRAEFQPWLVRNVIVWHRPNPAVGALGDKVRPSTSYIVIATRSPKRWFDLTAVRSGEQSKPGGSTGRALLPGDDRKFTLGPYANTGSHEAGAPPLDAWFDQYDGTHDTWTLTTQPSPLCHYAMWPSKLAERLILMMCPREVCRVCGEARRRVEGKAEYVRTDSDVVPARLAQSNGYRIAEGINQHHNDDGANTSVTRNAPTLGWTDCGHDDYRAGMTLDPFCGSGTSMAVADLHGRDAVGIDIDARNQAIYPRRYDEVKRALFGTPAPMPGQGVLAL